MIGLLLSVSILECLIKMAPVSNQPSTSGRGRKGKAKEASAPIETTKPPSNNISKLPVRNIVRCFDDFQHGRIKPGEIRRFGEFVISEKLQRYSLESVDDTNFDRRVTAVRFHPSVPSLLAFGSKSGTLVVRSLQTPFKKTSCTIWDGIGPGGSITDISFDPFSNNCVFTSSIDGTIKHRNYNNESFKTLLDTETFERWYCSVNASETAGVVIAGDTNGVLKVLGKDHKILFEHKIHKKKVNSIDFCKSSSWLFATASLDSTVKVWDLRKIDVKSPLANLPHSCPVNSAYFSLTNGNRLLTTDQHDELRVYKSPLFHLERTIRHPHRQFQHLTPIKASWHPFCDLIVVGRYPDPSWPTYYKGELRSIDIISAETGEMRAQLYSPSASGIVSLCSFNSTGDKLAVGNGRFIIYWGEGEPGSLYPLVFERITVHCRTISQILPMNEPRNARERKLFKKLQVQASNSKSAGAKNQKKKK